MGALSFSILMNEVHTCLIDGPVTVHSASVTLSYRTEGQGIPRGEASCLKVGMSWDLAKLCGLVSDGMKETICDADGIITSEGLDAWEALREYRLTADDVAPPMTDEDRAGLDERNKGRPRAA